MGLKRMRSSLNAVFKELRIPRGSSEIILEKYIFGTTYDQMKYSILFSIETITYMMENISFFTLALLALALIFAYLYLTRNFDYWKKRNVYYIKPIPLFGNLLPVFGMRQILAEWLGDLTKKIDKDYFGLFVFDKPVLVIKSPKHIKAVLQKDFSYFQNRSSSSAFHHPILSNFLFFTNNPKWKKLRTNASPVFSSGKLKKMFPLMLKEAKQLCQYLRRFENVPNVESKEICAKYGTNVITISTFAVDAKSFESENAEFRNLGRKLFDFRISTAIRQFTTFLAPKFADCLRITFIDPKVTKRLYDIFKEVLQTKIASDGLDSSLKQNDMIDIFLETSRKGTNIDINDKVIAGQAMQLFIAGFETVSSILSFSLYELCIQPEIQEKLRSEIFETIEKYNDELTYEGVSEMKYLDMCIYETLRKYPTLPFLDRQCSADYKLPNSDLIIEKGTPVYMSTFGLHYNPEYFPEPEKYIPERFEDKSKINSDGLFYVPFGEGPRICIGNRFGILAVKTGLSLILSKYRVVPTDRTPIPIKFEVKSLVLQSTVGVPLQFEPLAH
ncbi:cytochrome P450 6k1-like [Euwallacea fornicatus]|uniref:cytochrome P450 6k1-like n=1 Tax=Euwallacea fornicatus TaxID=995702 RepID=UPI00338EF5FE